MRNNFLNSVAYDPIAEPCAAKTPQNTGGGTSRTKNRSVTVNLSSGTTTNREMTERRPREDRETFVLGFLKYAACMLMLLFVGVGNVWGEEVKLVSVGNEAVSMIAGEGTAPNFFNDKTYKSGDESYSVTISLNTFTTAQGSEYKPDGTTKYKDYYYNVNSTCDMSGTPANYIKVSATNCKISKIVVRGACASSTIQSLPAVGFVNGLPETTTIGSNAGRRADVIISDQTCSYTANKRFDQGSAATYIFSTNVSEVYFSKQFKKVALPSASAWSSVPSSSQTYCVFGMDVYVVPEGSKESAINYTNLKGADNSANPTKYTEGTGIASFTDLADVTGYSFAGWDPASISASATGEQTINATWTANTHSLTWNIPVDATITNPETYTHGTVAYGTAIVAPTLSRAGYDFLGWDATPEATMPDNDLEYTAQWQAEAQKFDITYSNLKGSDVSAYPTKYSKGIGIASFAPLADVEGFHFTGWSPASISTTDEGDKEIEAQWIPTYSLTYNLNGGTGTLPTETAKYATQEFALAAQGDIVAPANKQFLGWKDQDGNKYAAEANFTMPGKAVTLTAYWAAKVEDVIYSWESPEGTPIETGGTAKFYTGDTDNSSATENNRVNYANNPINGDGATLYYTLRLDKDVDYSAEHVRIFLNSALKEGDKIAITAYYTKNQDKTIAPKIANGSNEVVCSTDNLVNLYNGGTPVTQTKTLNDKAEGATTLKLTRSATSTTAWITKLQIVRESYVDEDLLLTVKFNYNDGVTPNATIQVATGQAVAQPANPTWAHHRFNEWQLAGSAYDFSSAVTGNITLVADWTQLYTITYAKGDEGATGDAPVQEDKAQGETFTVAANPFTVAGKDFVKWNDGTNDYAPGATYTVGTDNVVLTAQWKAAADKYTVIFKDGTTELGTKLFDVTTNPSDADIDKTKALCTFAAWQKEGVDIALDDAFWATVAKDAEITLTARWAKAFALDIDFEAFIDAEGTSGDWGAELAAKNYAISSTTNVTLDAPDSKPADKGLKIKNSGSYISFNVNAGKLVLLKAGVLSGAEASVDGGTNYTALSGASGSTGASVVTPLYNADEAEYRIRTTTGSYNIIQAITITNPFTVSFEAHGDADPASLNGTPSVTLPSATNGTESFLGWFTEATGGEKIGNAGDSYTPTADITLHAQWEAVSTDARLSAITFSSDAGTLAPAFDPEVTEYTYTMPYGTASIPTITGATAVNANAQTPIIGEAVAAWGEAQTIKGVAQSGDKKTYTITMKVAPKDGVCLVWADIPSNSTITYNATKSKYFAESDVTLATTVNGKDGSAPSGVKFQGSTYIHIGGAFLAGDVLALDVTYAANGTNQTMYVYDAQAGAEENIIGTLAGGKTPAGLNEVTLMKDAADLWLVRGGQNSDWNPHVDYVAVYRPMNPVLKKVTVNGVEGTPVANVISIEVPASTTQPQLEAIAYDWVSNNDEWTAAHTPAAANTWEFGVANTVTLTDKDGDASVYTITVTKAEASHDATLSALSVEGYSLSPAFDPAVLTYNVELAKGTVIADLLAVSYTLNHVGATAVKTDATALPGATTIVVTAEDGLEANKKTYTINFTVSTKDKVVIFDGSTDEALRDVPAALATEGFAWVKNSDDAGKFKYIEYTSVSGYTHAIYTNGSSNANRNIAVTIPSKYEAQFEIAQASNSDATRHAYVGAANNTAYADALFSVESASKTDGQKATSEALAGGKTYYIHSDNSINILEINLYIDRVSEAPAISAQPAALAVCDAATNTNALSVTASVEAGTLSYQWYKVVEEGDDVAVGTNSNEFVPTALGDYYVVVTNTEGSYKPSSTKSEIATVSLKAQTEITGFENAAAPLNTEKTLSVTAAGTGTLTYKWQACTEAGVVTDENVLSSAAAYDVTITEEPQYYLVTVEGECGSATQVLFAKKWADLELVDVDGSMTWNFAASNTGITEDVTVPSTMVLANAGQGAMPNTDNFRSDMLKAIVGSTGTAVRQSSTDGGCYQGTGIMFHTTVPGIVTVTYRGTGNNADVTLTVGSKTFDTYQGAWKTCDKVFVPAGDVEISSVGTMRIQKIVFNAEPDYTRNVTEGRFGTICLPNGGVMVGAELFEIAYYGESTQKVFLDNIINGEMEAGRPYIFLPKEGTTQLAVFYTDEANASQGSHNGLIGFIGDAEDAYFNIPAGEGNYILQNNYYREVPAGAWARIKSNRAYIKLSAINPHESALAPGRRRISMGVQSEQVATGMENTGFESEAPRKVLINGELFIIRGEKMYDAKGQLVK
ncbi:MAG: InlB B-repeat-containing protein [Paludibacteraceae bacterium]|nr:InlB B-repeat-containing protein [Paludibacteraceae bacterium]